MRGQFMNSPEDCQWLWKTKLGKNPNLQPGKAFNSFILFGNEDAPEAVDLYVDADPDVTATAHRITFLGERT
jgi:hypothetical protein